MDRQGIRRSGSRRFPGKVYFDRSALIEIVGAIRPSRWERGVKFLESPREESYGTVAVFEDIYGNRRDLMQLKTTGTGEN